MIIRENFGEEHIRELQGKSRMDPQLIERALYALGLLESLAQTGMSFIFKGGSCLMTETPYESVSSYEEYANEPLTQADLRVLSKMRKAQPIQYAYLVKADRLLSEFRE